MHRNTDCPIEVSLRFQFSKSLAFCMLVAGSLLLAQNSERSRDWPGKETLVVGTCYQPVDRSPEQVHRDVALMKASGFRLVRLGDLSWDWYEPSDGKFTFEQSDQVIKELNDAGIKVLFDISGLPAPIWLHHEHPSVNVVTAEGEISAIRSIASMPSGSPMP
jgi:beta-galactosidase